MDILTLGSLNKFQTKRENSGTLHWVGLVLHGTNSMPHHVKTAPGHRRQYLDDTETDSETDNTNTANSDSGKGNSKKVGSGDDRW